MAIVTSCSNTVFPNVSDITALPRHFTFWPLAAMQLLSTGLKIGLSIIKDCITAYRCVWDHDESCFIIKGSRIPLGGSSERERARRVVALETVMVPAGQEAVIKSGLTNQSKCNCYLLVSRLAYQ
jgi:hypothetical protein